MILNKQFLLSDFTHSYRFTAHLDSGASSGDEDVQFLYCECVSGQGNCSFDDPEDDYDMAMPFVKVTCECDEEYTGKC